MFAFCVAIEIIVYERRTPFVPMLVAACSLLIILGGLGYPLLTSWCDMIMSECVSIGKLIEKIPHLCDVR